MFKELQGDVRNNIIRVCRSDDFEALRPFIRIIDTKIREVLIEPMYSVNEIYFPETGFVSVVYKGVEVGIIGREGAIGSIQMMLGDGRSPHSHVVQMAGRMLCIDVDEFCKAIARSTSLHTLMLRFAYAQMIQTAQTAFCNATTSTEGRLARWLLMIADRGDGSRFHFTHEFLAMMLGVQRTGVTMALQTLEGKKLIRARRGTIDLLDWARLKALAGDSYGISEAEYSRLMKA